MNLSYQVQYYILAAQTDSHLGECSVEAGTVAVVGLPATHKRAQGHGVEPGGTGSGRFDFIIFHVFLIVVCVVFYKYHITVLFIHFVY